MMIIPIWRPEVPHQISWWRCAGPAHRGGHGGVHQRAGAAVSEREQEQIRLYAKAQEFIINSEVASSNNFVFERNHQGQHHHSHHPHRRASTTVVDTKNLGLPAGLAPAPTRWRCCSARLAQMKQHHPPIVVELGAGARNYIYYKRLAAAGPAAHLPAGGAGRHRLPGRHRLLGSALAPGRAEPRVGGPGRGNGPPAGHAAQQPGGLAAVPARVPNSFGGDCPSLRSWARTSGGWKSSPSGSPTSARCRCSRRRKPAASHPQRHRATCKAACRRR
ncbi:MAG: hypothetical protein WKG07_26675 [Hymenobacter sp.]